MEITEKGENLLEIHKYSIVISLLLKQLQGTRKRLKKRLISLIDLSKL